MEGLIALREPDKLALAEAPVMKMQISARFWGLNLVSQMQLQRQDWYVNQQEQ
jgi:hypothetical protein